MKKILLFVLLLLVLALAAAGVFIATFNLDRYRPLIVQKASEAVGAPVEMGRVSLAWRSGLALRLEDLVVYTDEQSRSVFMKLKEVSVSLQLAPLLKKQVRVAAVVLLKPELSLVRLPDGSMRLPGGKPAVPGSAPEASGAAPGQASPPISVDSFKLRDGRVQFEDQTSRPPAVVTIRDLDLDVKNFSLTGPFSFRMNAAVLGAKQNFQAEGKVTLPRGDDSGSVEDTALVFDLGALNLAELSRAIPASGSAGFETLQGTLEARLDRLSLKAGDPGPLDGTLRLTDGRVKLTSVKSPFEDVDLRAALKADDLRLEGFSANFAGGSLKANGIVKKWKTQALSGLTWSAKDLVIDQMMPESGGGSRLNGQVSLDFEGQAAGLAWPQVSQSLVGRGQLVLKEGVLLNFNVLRKVIDKLSVIPGAQGMITSRLPPMWLAKMDEPSTLLKPAQLPFVVQGGFLLFNQLELATEGLAIRGAGQVGLDRMTSAKAAVQLDRGLSEMIVSGVPQIQLLLNARGEIEVPMQIQGRFPQLQILPDTEYIAQKLLTSQITNLIQNPEQGIQQVRNLLDKPVGAGEAGAKSTFAGLLQAIGQQDSGTGGSGS